LDNTSIYRSPCLRELCKVYGIELVFLLPYSPDFNPIEVIFHDLKVWIRRNYQLATNFADFGRFLEYSVLQGAKNTKAYYKEAGYIIN